MSSKSLPDTNRVASSVFSVIFSEDHRQVLYVRRRDVPLWCLPGGGIDPGETPEEAAVREVFEETGYRARVLRKVAEYSTVNFLTQPVHCFELILESGEPVLTDETSGIGFFDIDSPPNPTFHMHVAWVNDAATKSKELICRPQHEVTLPRIIWAVLTHPLIIVRYFMNKWGYGIHAKDVNDIEKRR